MTTGYIYIRCHTAYNGTCKLGKTANIPERDGQYATGELHRGEFIIVYSVPSATLIERLLKYEFQQYNNYYGSGTEFYSLAIIDLIEPYFTQIGIKYKKLTTSEINNLIRKCRVRQVFNKLKPHLIKLAKLAQRQTRQRPKIQQLTPRPDQLEIIDKAYNFYQLHKKGLLVIPCGVGKTLIALWIAKKLNVKTILIGVPNLLLNEQWAKVVKLIFGTPSIIKAGCCIDNLNNVVITTYASAHKLLTLGVCFDLKINDEAHHLTSQIDLATAEKEFIQMLKIPALSQLSLTATLKVNDLDKNVISNNNVEYFGEIIEQKSLLWAINKKIICDYVIQTIITDEDIKGLSLAMYAAIQSIQAGDSHHLLIYANCKENTEKLVSYGVGVTTDNIFIANYHSDMSVNQRKKILEDFNRAPKGIICCVYCLGEGFDFPLLDGVVFSENMSSNIRIVQSALRASRLNAAEPAKVAKIILPVGCINDKDNPDLKKAREVIYQMGLEDETIVEKIKIIKIGGCEGTNHNNFKNVDDELASNLKLLTINRQALAITYAKARKIIANKCNTKEEYYNLCILDNRLHLEPEIYYKGQFTSWPEYLGIDRTYYTLAEARVKINEFQQFNVQKYYLDLATLCDHLRSLDPMFPPCEWSAYYGLPLNQIIIKHEHKKKKSNIIR